MTVDIFGLGNALVDSEYVVSDRALAALEVEKGLQVLIDEDRLAHILSVMAEDGELGGELHKQASGGSAGNTIMAAQNFGAQTFYACRVADDAIGKFFCEDMRNGGVQLNESLAIMPTGHSGQCMVMITEDAERTMNTYLGVSSELSTANIDEACLRESRYLYLEGYMAALENSVEAACYAKQQSKAAGGQVALSFSDPAMAKYCQEGLAKIVGDGVDILLCNEEEALLYTGESTVESAMQMLAKHSDNVVTTLGAKGAAAIVSGQTYQVGAEPIEVLNTNGAGDAFAGAYLYAMSQGWSVDKALQLANATSGKVIVQYGPRLSRDAQQAILASIQ